MSQKSSLRSGLIFFATLIVLALIVTGGWAIVNHKVELPAVLGGAEGNGQTLTVATAQPISSLDMISNTSSALDQALLHNVYDTLVGRDEKNQPAPTGLAKNWSISPDGLTYTFKLYSGMNFSNGHTANADDVVASLKQTLKKQTLDSTRLRRITSVNGNNLTVKITLSQADPNLLWALSTRAGIIYDSQATYDAAKTAVGSGPYQIEAFEAGKSLTLTVNPHYGKKIKGFSTIKLVAYPDANAAVDALEAKKVDAILPLANSPATANVAAARQKLSELKDVTVATTASTHRWAIALNTSADSLFSDTHIRQAYRAMLNQSELISALGVSAVALSAPVPSLDPGYQDLTGTYHVDIAQARQYLSFYGYARNFTLSYPQSIGDAFAQTVASQLVAVGGTVTPQAVPDNQWQSQIVEGKQFDMAIIDLSSSHDLLNIASPDYITQYTSPDTNTALDNARKAANDNEYTAAMTALSNQIADASPIIWAYEEQPIVAERAGITGMPKALADSYVQLENIVKE